MAARASPQLRGHTTDALRTRLHLLAADIGRMRRQLDTLADHLEALIIMVEPTAAELAATIAPGDEEAVREAIRVVDARHRQRQKQLGARP